MRKISQIIAVRCEKALVALFVISGFLFMASSVSAETLVNGSITQDVTWTTDQSPIHVNDDFTVYPGYTLTIKPGVFVLIDDAVSLQIRGALEVQGEKNQNVTFTATDGKNWNGVDVRTDLGGSLSATFLEISYAKNAISVRCCNTGGPLTIADSYFHDNTYGLTGYAGSVVMRVDRTLFENNDSAVSSADKDIYDSIFRGNTCGLCSTERINVFSSLFENNATALYGGRGEIQKTMIQNNDIGVKAFYEGFDITESTIIRNKQGIILNNYDATLASIHQNNIYGNSEFNISNNSEYNQNLNNNYWGTTDEAAIRATIVDGYTNALKGLVEIFPFLTEEVSISENTDATPHVDPITPNDDIIIGIPAVDETAIVNVIAPWNIIIDQVLSNNVTGHIEGGTAEEYKDRHVRLKIYRTGKLFRTTRVALNADGSFIYNVGIKMQNKIARFQNHNHSIRVKVQFRDPQKNLLTTATRLK